MKMTEEINDVKTFMSQVLPIKPVRDYMYRLLSSFVCGKVKEQKFHIWTGCGGNGKSKLIELFRMGFGDYCCTLPVSLLTQKRGRAEGATPALAQTKGKRFACLQEPEGDETINVGLMKELMEVIVIWLVLCIKLPLNSNHNLRWFLPVMSCLKLMLVIEVHGVVFVL